MTYKISRRSLFAPISALIVGLSAPGALFGAFLGKKHEISPVLTENPLTEDAMVRGLNELYEMGGGPPDCLIVGQDMLCVFDQIEAEMYEEEVQKALPFLHG